MHPALQKNTRRGIETAGLLAGTFSARENSFSITRLFIPKQKGEPNNVEMLNEEDLVEHFFDESNESVLVILGWIHTHPTQSCFLSSIDVHTQCGYQVCTGHRSYSWQARGPGLGGTRGTLARHSTKLPVVLNACV